MLNKNKSVAKSLMVYETIVFMHITPQYFFDIKNIIKNIFVPRV